LKFFGVLLMGLVSVFALADDKDAVPASVPAVAQPAPTAGLATNLPPAPPSAPLAAAPAIAPAVLVQPEHKHRFFDVQNSLGLALLGAGLTGDALSTQKGLGRPGYHEINPIARPFVQSRAGAAAYSAGSFALMGSGMYLAHKTGHHRLERVLPLAIAGWEGFLAARNYHVISSSTPAH
jgi:hypothetical protein